jgi:hypothetical protein
MSGKHLKKALAYILSALLVVAVLAYIVGGIVVRHKVTQMIGQLPASVKVTYSSLHPLLFQSALIVKNLDIQFTPDSGRRHHITVEEAHLEGIGFFTWIVSHKVRLRTLRLEGVTLDLDKTLLDKDVLPKGIQIPFTEASIGKIQLVNARGWVHQGDRKDLSAEGDVEVDSIVFVAKADTPDIRYGGMRCQIKDIQYTRPESYDRIHVRHLALDSRTGALSIDSIRITPTVSKLELGKIKGHQEDFLEGTCTGVSVTHLDIQQLRQHRLVADKIQIKGSQIYVFRDRRLPLEAGDKPMPVTSLKSLPIDIRVQSLDFGPVTFTYEEYPKEGDKTGSLRIEHLKGHLSPLVNHPQAGDPAYITLVTEGSLMGSGTVDATTRMPLHKGDPYIVEGAFHNLDVTSLNPPAENLGDLHLESGMLNNLSFWFTMTDEKSTGKIIGEYHDLVVDKLKAKGDEKKTDKFKSFFLKHLIIAKDKDRTLAVSKRTGKVDYKHDPTRYFSYYMLHSLLVGVKSSFSLGFLLPG